MANDMVAVMEKLGFSRFFIAGHDRGGRVAYRLALDHPGRVERLAILDIIPGVEAWERADKNFATAFWPWTFLSQPAPLPEQLIAGAPGAMIDDALNGWGTPAATFSEEVREAYMEQFCDPAHVHAICEEYRAAATLDIEHDEEDRKYNRRITCPVLALWSAGGPLDTWYHAEGGPLELWRKWADNVQGWAIKGGHFFPEEVPEETATAFRQFFYK
jgi:haloacetate dehalogenase